MSSAIATTGLVKLFWATVALDGLDFDVATAEVRGFLGPNGAAGVIGLQRRDLS